MGKANRPSPGDLVYAYELSSDFRPNRYLNFKAHGQPIIMGANGFALPTAVQGQTDRMSLPGGGGHYVDLFQTTAQTLMPLENTLGLEIALDQVDNETVEYVPGGNSARSPFAFTVGTDSDFFIRAKFAVTDVSGTDQFFVGFRKQEAFAVPTALVNAGDGIYTDFGGLLLKSGDVFTLTDLNNSGSAVGTDTLFNWADTEIHQLEVRVVGGKALYLINGVRLGNPVAKDGDGTAITSQSTNTGAVFTFDSGDVLVPTIIVRQDADLTPVYLRELEIGHLTQRGLDPNNE